MALTGQGDPRWIVNDRGDGRNVNNWHWTERDASEWARARVSALLRGAAVRPTDGGDAPPFECRTVDVDSVSGDCVLYNRKNRVKAVYDLKVKAKWEARPVGATGAAGADADADETPSTAAADVPLAKGTYDFELYDDDPDVNVHFDTDTPQAADCKRCMKEEGRAVVANCMRQFLRELRDGGDTSLGVSGATRQLDETNISAPARGERSSGSDGGARCGGGGDAGASGVEQSTRAESTARAAVGSGSGSGRGSSPAAERFELTERFDMPRERVFEALTDPHFIRAFTMANAEFSMPADGGAFTMLNGQVHGKNVEVTRPRRIVQRWRMADWEPAEHFSTVTMELRVTRSGDGNGNAGDDDSVSDEQRGGAEGDSGGGTKVRLVHESVPADAVERTRAGWHNHIFGRLRLMLNMGTLQR